VIQPPPKGNVEEAILFCAGDVKKKTPLFTGFHTVDGRNPVPPDMYETLQIIVYLPYQLVKEFINSRSLVISSIDNRRKFK